MKDIALFCKIMTALVDSEEELKDAIREEMDSISNLDRKAIIKVMTAMVEVCKEDSNGKAAQ